MTNSFVLIIEDDPTLGEIFEKTMQQAGFDTALDAYGNRYTALIADRVPVLVILDIHLPFASGKQILADLRHNPSTTAVPVLIVTADLYHAKDLQADNEQVILKPVTPTRLIKTVQTILNTPDNG